MPKSANENDDFGKRRPEDEPDAHGQAALMLAESILHALVETATFTDRQALDVVRTAQEVKTEIATLDGESHRRMQESLDLLDRIAISVGTDIQ